MMSWSRPSTLEEEKERSMYKAAEPAPDSTETEFALGAASDGGRRAMKWGLAVVSLWLLASAIFFFGLRDPGPHTIYYAVGADPSSLAPLAGLSAFFTPLLCIAVFAGWRTKTSSKLVIDGEGWQWEAAENSLASQTWEDSGGIRVRMGLTNWIEVLNMDGSVYRRIPISKHKWHLDPILTRFDRALPIDRVRAIHTSDRIKKLSRIRQDGLRLLGTLALSIPPFLMAFTPLPMSGGDILGPAELAVRVFFGVCGSLAVVSAIVGLVLSRKFAIRDGEPALFRFPVAGTSPLSILNQASAYLFKHTNRKKLIGALSLIEVQEGYIELIYFNQTRCIRHGEFKLRSQLSDWGNRHEQGWIIIEADPEVWIPDYRAGQIDLYDLLKSLEKGEQPDLELLSTDVIEWLYRDQDLEEEVILERSE
jgi:hypothetical protein